MEDVGMKLKWARVEKKLTQLDVMNMTGIGNKTISDYEHNRTSPDPETLKVLCELYEVDPNYILGTPVKSKNEKIGIVKIPVLGRVQAGIPVEAVEEILDYEEITSEMASTGEYFGLRIRGTSMEPQFIDGDTVIVRKQSNVESGDIAVVLVNGSDATVKKFVKHGDEGISLTAFNPMFPPKFYTSKQVSELPVVICGRVVELRRKI